MRVAFDQNLFASQEYGGATRYLCNLAARLAELPGVQARIFAPLHVNGYLPGLPSGLATGLRVRDWPHTERVRAVASRLIARPLMQAFRPDVVHETYYAARAFAPRGAARVITAYDMIHERFAGTFDPRDPTTFWKSRSFARADRIICISETTRRDMLELFDVPAAKLAIVYLGFSPLPTAGAPTPRPEDAPYLLYVGQRWGYKNFGRFVRAYASSEWLRGNFRIVCFGGGAFTSAEKHTFAASGVAETRIRQMSGDDSVLAGYYRHAAAFVYPSLYEGFGVPPLEAMSEGCPVVCSGTSSIPEVVGTAGEYFDPANIESIRASIERVLQSAERRADLTARGVERCKVFTWEKCAAETLAVYRGCKG